MPEWVTHVAFGFLLALLLKRQLKFPVLVGAILPDLIGKLALPAAFLIGSAGADSLFGIGHTPAGALVVAIGIAAILPQSFKQTFYSLALGVASHFALDLLQGPYGQQLLWPLLTQQFGLNLWYSDSVLPLAVTLVALGVYTIHFALANKD